MAFKWALISLLLATQVGETKSDEEIIDETFADGTRVRCSVTTTEDGHQQLHGTYVRWYPDGKKACFGRYRDGERHGKWKFYGGPPGAAIEGSYSNGSAAGKWTFSPAKDVQRVGGKIRSEEHHDEAGRKTADGGYLGGLRQQRWVFYRTDGTRMLEGDYVNGVAEGTWLLYHANGRIDPALITGVYRDGVRVGAAPEWHPKFRFAPPVTTNAVSPLPTKDVPHLEEAVAACLAGRARSQVVQRNTILSARERAVPHILNALLVLDLSNEDHRNTVRWVESELLKPIHGGHGLPTGDAPAGAGAEEVRLAILRWMSLSELIRERPLLFAIDFAGPATSIPTTSLNPLTTIGPLSASLSHEHYSRRRQGGGAKTVRRAVAEGLDWIARHQELDGRFSCSGFGGRCKDNRCDGEGDDYDVGVTSLAVLAFLSSPVGDKEPTYGRHVMRALGWLVSMQDLTSGQITSEPTRRIQPDGSTILYMNGRFNYESAIATAALCEATFYYPSPGLRTAAERGVKYLLAARNPYKAWGNAYPPDGNNEMSLTGWCVIALVTARRAGLEVDEAAFEGARLFIDEMTDENTWRTGWMSKGGYSAREPGMYERWPETKTEAMTAEAMLCRILLGEDPETSPALRGGADLLRKQLPLWDEQEGTIDYIYWMFGTYAMYQMSGQDWHKWQMKILDAIVKTQRQDGDERGSWDPQFDPWGHLGGRIYSTAAMTLALQTYVRYDWP